MSMESPTLKMRLELVSDIVALGRDCHSFASREIVGERTDVVLLDAKWGRMPSKWRESGGWGRGRLTDFERGYVKARTDAGDESELLSIIKRLAT